MLRREVIKMGGGLFGLGAGTPSRFPYATRPQPSPAVAPSPGIVVRANRVIVFGPAGTPVGVFVYAAGTTPALGNIPVAWISESTVDPFGNVLPSPATDIATFNSVTHELAWMSKGAVHVGLTTDFNPGSVTGVSGSLSIGSPLATGADVPGSVHLDSVLSPRGNGVTPQVKLFNGTVIAANGAAVPVIGGLAVTGGTTTDNLNSTGLLTVSDGTNTWTADRSLSSATEITLTNPTVAADLTDTFTIPANTAKAGTFYILEVPFDGTWEASGALNLGIDLNGVFTNIAPVATGLAVAGHGYGGTIRLYIKIINAGAGGNCNIWTSGDITDTSVARAGATSSSLFGILHGRAFNNAVVNTVALAADFSVSNAAQTIIGRGSTFTRRGA